MDIKIGLKTMKEAIKKLINKWACHHEWKLWHKINVCDDFGGYYTVFHFRCTKCGKIKKVKEV